MRSTSDTTLDRSDRYCIIGAGPSGLAAARNLKRLGIPFDVIEAHADVGGIWDIKNDSSTVYASTHTITSKTVTAFPDMPMPEGYPIYMHHTLVLEYLRSYAKEFDLYPYIELSTRVTQIDRAEDAGWTVGVKGPTTTSTRRYRGVILANGHNWSPKLPEYPGKFEGESFHSKEYKSPERLAGKRVLVVGSGNTGCDIAVETSRVAAKTFLSARRGYYYLPKFLLGIPSDSLGQSSQSFSLPIWLIRFFYRILLWMTMGDQVKYGLPKPDHGLLETPPIANSLMPYFVAHGAVRMKGDIARFDGGSVVFQDGTREEIDVVVYATGFKPDFPFIGKEHLAWKGGRPHPHLFIFHPEYNDLFFAGLTDGTGGHFPTVHHGTELLARFLWALDHDPAGAEEIIAAKKGPPPDLSRGIRFIETPRNYTQFELHYYTRLLRSLSRKLERRAAAVPRRERPALPAAEAT